MMRALSRRWELCFFFQEEDGRRDSPGTGVQACALPIYFVKTIEEAMNHQRELGFPIIGRPSFTMGGAGGGVLAVLESAASVVVRRRRVGEASRLWTNGCCLRGVLARADVCLECPTLVIVGDMVCSACWPKKTHAFPAVQQAADLISRHAICLQGFTICFHQVPLPGQFILPGIIWEVLLLDITVM